MRRTTLSKYILALGLAAGLSACADLEQSALSSIDKNQFYQSQADIEAAINGIYQEFTVDGFYGMFNNQSIYINDLQTDYVKAGAQTNSAHIRELSNFAVQPTNIFVQYAWQEHYTGINRANVVIDKVAQADFLSEEQKRNYAAEARFLRAVYYFNLVRYFGGVPLILHDGEGEGWARNSVDEVYAQIVADFKAAEELPADYTTLDSRASSLAATAFLSKVYLVWAQTITPEAEANQASLYKQSIENAKKVVESGKYSLLDKFIDNWQTDKKNGSEHIFSIEHKYGVNGNVTGHCTFATNWSDSEPVLIATSTKYWEQADPNDQRRDGSWAKRLYNPSTGSDFEFAVPRFRKYIDSLNYANASSFGNVAGQSISTTVIRYAEVLLILAEAENELNGPTATALDALNQVRRRAYWDPYASREQTPSDGRPVALVGLSQSDFRQALRQERWSEFILEGQRWFDLIRWHILVKTVRENTAATDLKYKNVSKRNYLLPLPNDQIILNPNLEQNWGYSGEEGDGPYDERYE